MKKSLVSIVTASALVLSACSDGESEQMTASNVIETPTTVAGTEAASDAPSIQTAEDWVKEAAGMTPDQNFSDAAVDDSLPDWAAVVTGAEISNDTLTVSIDDQAADTQGEAEDVVAALTDFARTSQTESPEPFTTVDVVNSAGETIVSEAV